MAEHRQGGLGALLRRHRLVAGLSQQDLAERAGLSVDAVAALERGRRRSPRAFTVRLLADALALDEAARRGLVDAASGAAEPRAGGTAGAPPAPFGPLVGRDEDSDAVVAALRDGPARLLTLTGPGGVGKTQLALTAAQRLTDAFPGGVGWASLVSLDDPDGVGHAVAAAVGLREVPGRSVEEALVGELGSRTMLLVLDNCEHLVVACAMLVERLLAGTTGLRILATSRERLRVGAEHVWPVAPLAAPDPDSGADVADAPAVRLFVDRARQLVPDFTLDSADRHAVARICRQLDGIPLALELAAARTNVLSVAEIAEGLDDSIGSAAARGAPDRHRSLRSTIDWSHDLLTDEERRGLRQLAVFAGGWTLASAAAVCPAIGDESRALALTSSLVDRSLAVTHPAQGGRFFLLFTVRRYALDRLHSSGEQRTVEDAYTRYVADLAERAEPCLYGGRQREWVRRIDAELGNVRAALGRSRHDGGPLGLRIAGALWRYCYLTGRYGEGRDWLDAALAGDRPADDPYAAKALLGAGVLAFLQCDYDVATSRIGAALERYQRDGDDDGVAEARQRLGSVARERGEYALARHLHGESLAHWRAAGDVARIAESLNYLGAVAWLTGDFDGTERLCEESLRTYRELGDGEGTIWALLNLGATATYRDRRALADALLRESLRHADDIGFTDGLAWSLNLLGTLTRRAGDREHARELLVESLEVHLEVGDAWRAATVFEELAATVVGTDPKLAARLLGAADQLRTVTTARRPPVEQAEHDATVAKAVAALGDAAFEEQRAIGRAGTRDDRMAEVREVSPD